MIALAGGMSESIMSESIKKNENSILIKIPNSIGRLRATAR
jgi:hypothetical protein